MTQEALKLALEAHKKNERHNTVAETRYWCNQYKLLAEQALAQSEQEPTTGNILMDSYKAMQAKKLTAQPERDYERGFIDGMQKQMQSSVDKAVNRLAQPEQEPVAWQLWVGADTPLNSPMGWQFYSTYDSLKSAEISARTINSYQQAPFAKVVPLYPHPPQRTFVGLEEKDIPDGEDPMFDHKYFIAGMVYAANKLMEKNA